MEEFPQDCWVVEERIENTSIGEKYSYASFRAFSQMVWRSIDSPTPFASMSATGNAYKINQLQSSTMFQRLPRVLRKRTTAQYKWHWDKENILNIVSKQPRKVSN
ncbi:hypothetical protein R3I94_001648 [Phoxinus phoxinus]